MPSFIPATGITLHLEGECVNRIGVLLCPGGRGRGQLKQALAHNNELVSHFNNLGDRSRLLWRAKSKRHHPVKNRYCSWLF